VSSPEPQYQSEYLRRQAEREAALAEKEKELNSRIDEQILKNPDQMPKAVWFILPNEFCERFCFYGVSPLLFKYFKEYLGQEPAEAVKSTAFFGTMVYFFPLLGMLCVFCHHSFF
jgi:dipeptide/tripeptide permease